MNTIKYVLFLPTLFVTGIACAVSFKASQAEDGNFQVKTETCGSEKAKVKVVIFPPTGGATTLERWYAEKICDRGGFAILINDWTEAQETATDPELHDRHMQRSLKVYKNLEKKWKGPFRVLGTSLGGLYAAAISMHHPWEKMVLITAGGPLSQVLATSDLTSLIELREKREKLWNFRSEQEYEGILGKAISLDLLPPRYPNYVPKIGGVVGPSAKASKSLVPSEQILMSLASSDGTVPYETQEKLWEALGKPKRFDLSGNHFFGILWTYWYYSEEISDFLAGDLN